MAPETEIDKPPAVIFRLFDIRFYDMKIILDRLNLPDHIISQPQHINSMVKPGKPGACSVAE
jgi:hypothetical protein